LRARDVDKQGRFGTATGGRRSDGRVRREGNEKKSGRGPAAGVEAVRKEGIVLRKKTAHHRTADHTQYGDSGGGRNGESPRGKKLRRPACQKKGKVSFKGEAAWRLEGERRDASRQSLRPKQKKESQEKAERKKDETAGPQIFVGNGKENKMEKKA